MSNTGNDNYLIFIFEFFSPAYPYEKQNRREIYKNFTTFTVTIPLVLPIGTKDSEKFTKNFTIFTVTVPLVLPIGTKDSEKFTKISQYSQ